MKTLTHTCLALAVAAGLLAVLPAQARTLRPGESAVVNPGDAAEDWDLTTAEITMNSGAVAGQVDAKTNSTVSIDGATLTNTHWTLALNASTANVRGAVFTTTSGSNGQGGVSVVNSSEASFTDSSLTSSGAAWGMRVSNNSKATLVNTSVTSKDDAGMHILNADVSLSAGSRVIGATNAVQLEGTAAGKPLIIDGSHLESGTGSAILVTRQVTATTSDIQISNGSSVTAGNGVLLEADGIATANLTIDNSALTGNVINGVTSTTSVRLQNNASLTGAMTDVSSVALDTATWNVAGDSSVGSLALGNGTIAFVDPAGGAHKTLTVAGDFSGNDGTLLFNTVLADDASASDKLVVGGDTSGTANVRVNNVGGAGAQTVNGIELINVGGASNGVFNLAGRAVGGSYEYFLHKGTGTDGNWYLRSQLLTVPEPEPEPCDLDPTGPGCDPNNPGPGPSPGEDDPYPLPGPSPDPEPILRPEGGAYLANLHAAQQMFALGYHDRQQGQNGGGAWAKVEGSRNGFDAISRQLDVRGNSQSLSVGANVWQHDNGSSAGVMLSSGNATSTSTNELTGYYARGKVKGAALGVYGTWRAGNAADPYAGFYVDGSVQRAQFHNRVEGVALEAERYTSRAWRGAVEAGYAFRVGGASNGGIYLEPQLQVGYTRWDSGQHTEANGTVVQTKDANGLFGRAGVRLSGVTRAGNGGVEVQPYIAAHWLHTRAESQVLMNDEMVDARIPRSRGEFSGGASLNFGNGFGAWGALSLQKASGYHQTSAQVGLSYRW